MPPSRSGLARRPPEEKWADPVWRLAYAVRTDGELSGDRGTSVRIGFGQAEVSRQRGTTRRKCSPLNGHVLCQMSGACLGRGARRVSETNVRATLLTAMSCRVTNSNELRTPSHQAGTELALQGQLLSRACKNGVVVIPLVNSSGK